MALQRPKGTSDHLPDGSPKLSLDTQARAFQRVTDVARGVLERSGAQFIATPIFEEPELVRRGVGETSDIVTKEMFTVYYFGEHGGFILRPEGTASVMRAYLQNGLKQLPSPLKLWTQGPMFRAENVQKGRLRQFHQLDYEVIGGDDPLIDAEAVAVMMSVVEALGLRQVTLKLGSVGDPADRERYNAYLREQFGRRRADLSPESLLRLDRNPMRILDSKSAEDQAVVRELAVRPMLDFLGEQAQAHFASVRRYLDAWGVSYQLDPGLVRGLDYYRRSAWELHHAGVGAKSALGGGGRYDGLAEQLGGPATPGIGWALGIERLLIAMTAEGLELPLSPGPHVYLAALDGALVGQVAELGLQLRSVVRAEFAYRALKPAVALRDAGRRGAVYAALIGPEEAGRGVVALKHLSSGVQRNIGLDELRDVLGGPDFVNPDFVNPDADDRTTHPQPSTNQEQA
ncbi:histidine--tRNA ligase [Deinococcus sp.]|uniref:histidine--tRNA ligase n=1 Tax=Deinococcus sp. TaxID=47478 RepID=UPI0025F6C898|nr:histidine--tRNA ligase [Deinococcus sp.]